MGPGMDAPGGLEVRVTSISTGIDLLLVRRGTTLSCFRAEAEQAGWHAPLRRERSGRRCVGLLRVTASSMMKA